MMLTICGSLARITLDSSLLFTTHAYAVCFARVMYTSFEATMHLLLIHIL